MTSRPEANVAGPGYQAPKNTVLVVDDEADIRNSLKDLLEVSLTDTTVVTAANGREALELMAEHKPRVILADYKMPEMDGLKFLAEARQRAPSAARIMITAHPDVDIAIRAINEGEIERFLAKPFDPIELVAIVHDIVQEHRAREARYAAFARAFAALRERKAKA